MSGFSPGPWEADASSVHASNGIIADLYLDDETAEANARLIAAAPDLVEALDMALDSLWFLANRDEATLADKLRHAKATSAIAKARHLDPKAREGGESNV